MEKGEAKQNSLKTLLDLSLSVLIFFLIIILVIFCFNLWCKIPKTGIEKNTTISEINKAAIIEGVSFCDNIGDQAIKEKCVINAISDKAMAEHNTDYCNQIENKTLAYECKKKIIFAVVAIKYKEESAENPDLINPSNIELCDSLEEKDKNYCLNPKKMVMDCGGVFCYR